MQLEGFAAGLHLCSSRPLRCLKLVKGTIQSITGLTNLIEFENRLDFLGALCGFDENEPEYLAAGKSDFRMIGNFREGNPHVIHKS
jgi:hypothetical protein